MQKSKIQFETEEIDNVANDLVEVGQNVYTKKINKISNCTKFAIPQEIVLGLNLKPKTKCYFIKQESGYYHLYFNRYPEDTPKKYVHSRAINYAGMYKTLFLTIPIQITKELPKNINFIMLIQVKGMDKHEWIIQFHSTDCT